MRNRPLPVEPPRPLSLALLFVAALLFGIFWARMVFVTVGLPVSVLLLGALIPWYVLRFVFLSRFLRDDTQSLLFELRATLMTAPEAARRVFVHGLGWFFWPLTAGLLAGVFIFLLLFLQQTNITGSFEKLLAVFTTSPVMEIQGERHILLIRESDFLHAIQLCIAMFAVSLWAALINYLSLRRALVRHFLWPRRHYTRLGVALYAIAVLALPATILYDHYAPASAGVNAGGSWVVFLFLCLLYLNRERRMVEELRWREV